MNDYRDILRNMAGALEHIRRSPAGIELYEILALIAAGENTYDAMRANIKGDDLWLRKNIHRLTGLGWVQAERRRCSCYHLTEAGEDALMCFLEGARGIWGGA